MTLFLAKVGRSPGGVLWRKESALSDGEGQCRNPCSQTLAVPVPVGRWTTVEESKSQNLGWAFKTDLSILGELLRPLGRGAPESGLSPSAALPSLTASEEFLGVVPCSAEPFCPSLACI